MALGFVAFAMLGLQFALTARFRHIAAPFGLDTLLHFHRQAGIVAFLLALAHPLSSSPRSSRGCGAEPERHPMDIS